MQNACRPMLAAACLAALRPSPAAMPVRSLAKAAAAPAAAPTNPAAPTANTHRPAGVSADAREFLFNRPFKLYKLDLDMQSAWATRDELLADYHMMQRMRRLEIAADQLYKSKEIRGFCHLYLGQEAIACGIEVALTKNDHIITAYRDHAMLLGRGVSMESILAELMGRFTGCSKGKGGSMHMYSKETNFYGGNGIVGAQCPMGAGIALSQKILKTGQVTMTFYGDGAANQGQLYEAFNMAALWKLPVMFCCENNHYGMGTAIERSSALPEYYTKALFIPGLFVDGMDCLAVREATRFGKRYVNEHGPLVLEFNTYRYSGHSMSDPGTTYRSREEVANVRETRDPITLTRNRLRNANFATDEELKAIDKQVKDETDEAVALARAGAFPPLEETFTQVYKEPVPVRGVERSDFYYPPGHAVQPI